jgi:hypothetical protein
MRDISFRIAIAYLASLASVRRIMVVDIASHLDLRDLGYGEFSEYQSTFGWTAKARVEEASARRRTGGEAFRWIGARCESAFQRISDVSTDLRNKFTMPSSSSGRGSYRRARMRILHFNEFLMSSLSTKRSISTWPSQSNLVLP